MQKLALCVAQGFCIGRIPIAPGTFGSALGLLWLAVLLRTNNFWFYLLGAAAVLGLSVWLSGIAEKILQKKDPGSVVIDEIAAVPICFSGWVGGYWFKHHALPA